MKKTRGFRPLAAPGATVLILGTLPSRQSIERQEYFGNPQNAFWRIMGVLANAGPELPYARRTRRLTTAGVALWDVLQASIRPGSLDSAIDTDTAVANDFADFLSNYTTLRMVAFNGKKAASLFQKLVAPALAKPAASVDYLTLPSTSPAHAAMSFEEKLACWSEIKPYLQPVIVSGNRTRTTTQQKIN